MKIYNNPDVNSFWITSQFYMLPGLIKFLYKDGNFENTDPILKQYHQILSAEIFPDGIVYRFVNKKWLSKKLSTNEIFHIENLLKQLGWKYQESVFWTD